MLAINQIYHMDCFDFLDKVDDNCIDLIIADPPYNMDKAEWDRFDSHDSFLQFSYNWIDKAILKLKDNGSFYIFNTPFNSAFLCQYLVSQGMIFQNWITWDKRDGMGAGKRRYSTGQETILFFTKSQKHTFNFDDIRVPYESTERIDHAKKKGILKNGKRWFPNENGRLCGEVWHFSSQRHKSKVNGKVVRLNHITPKPYDLIERIVKASSNKGDLVMDCFMGSGTTAIVAKKLGRNFIGCEKNQSYIDFANSILTSQLKGIIMETKFVGDIDPSNKALEFIDYRLSFDSYRGIESSQHNRYKIDDVFKILTLLNKMRPNKGLLQIRVGDSSSRPTNLPEERDYAEFCNKAKEQTGIGTQDAMRKNLFVDWDRMGLIHRYGNNKEIVPPFSKKTIRYVSLSDTGLAFISERNPVDRNFMFSKLLNKFLNDFVKNVLSVITTTELNYITFDELMFFVSAINHPDYGISIQKCEKLILEYRSLSRIQKKTTMDNLKTKLNPKLFEGDKTAKRDYANWNNKYAQIWELFKELPIFIIDDETRGSHKIYLKSLNYNGDKDSKKDMNRSPQAKADYFKNHKIQKTLGYELDHIIPLLVAENIQEFHYLDNWKNLLYMDGKTHSIKSQQRSKHMILSFNNLNELTLKDTKGDVLTLVNGKESIFNSDLVTVMLKYNESFLNYSNTKNE